ncbi:MAG TPA: glycoside hydrolase family 57 protein [Candidatus Sulfotelmatobacter sp.]|nr:glycoside hydrolase family 57 protein [Candidatus Sulfotelmatobacter sp.]
MNAPESRVELLFLWHHHQPDYRSPREGRSLLPWVRLHATKDYLDMALRLERHPRLKATFNFVPSLIDQLEDARRGGRDALFELLARPAGERTPADLAELAERCSVTPPGFGERWPRYGDLRRRLQRARRAGALSRGWTARDQAALEAWFLLAWLDPMFHGEPEAARALAADPPGAAERDGLLALHRRLLADVLPAYRRLAERGQLELSTSPYAHPILPLLIDTSSASRSRPDVHLPALGLKAPDDARRQLQRALARHEEVFGAPPRGIWPPEGSVSPEAAALVAEAGLAWMATDEAILWQSLPAEARKRESLYQPWKFPAGGGEVAIFFRDHELSDRIGFVYHHWDPGDAASDFIGRVKRIGREHPGETPPIVSVILDGENCWEHYPGDGGPFLDALYQGLEAAGEIATVTPSEVLARPRSWPRLENLYTGSWIDADFHVWIGHPEKNRAWELLARTREDLVASGSSVESQPAAWSELDSAEGSDWFWWLGVDHFTPDRALFDHIFREHLQAVYEARGQRAPAWLRVPIVPAAAARARAQLDPLGFVEPIVDGRATSYYEWRAAGRLSFDSGGAMHRAVSRVKDLYFGADARQLHLRVDFAGGAPPGPGVDLEIEIRAKGTRRLRVQGLVAGERPVLGAADDRPAIEPSPGARAVLAQVLEIAIPLEQAGIEPGDEAELRVSLLQSGEVLERLPGDPAVRFVVPGIEDESGLWNA